MTGVPPNPTDSSDPQRLGCGRSIDEVWSRVDLPPDEHERTCPDCRAARSDLRDLARVTQSAVSSDAVDPTLQLDDNVLAGIVQIARAEVRRGRRIPMEQPLPGPTPDQLTVSEQTLANLIRIAGDTVEGIDMRRCSVTLLDAGDAASAGRPTEVRVDLRVSVQASAAIAEVTEKLRSTIQTAVADQVGIVVAFVNITVEDVHDD